MPREEQRAIAEATGNHARAAQLKARETERRRAYKRAAKLPAGAVVLDDGTVLRGRGRVWGPDELERLDDQDQKALAEIVKQLDGEGAFVAPIGTREAIARLHEVVVGVRREHLWADHLAGAIDFGRAQRPPLSPLEVLVTAQTGCAKDEVALPADVTENSIAPFLKPTRGKPLDVERLRDLLIVKLGRN